MHVGLGLDCYLGLGAGLGPTLFDSGEGLSEIPVL